MPPLQQRYYEILIERIRGDKYPSHQLLDRIEGTMWTSEQVAHYVAVLLEKVEQSWYPSHQLLDRVDRVLHRIAVSA
jgi:hypothetical protein